MPTSAKDDTTVKKGKILIIDDQKSAACLLKTLLNQIGYTDISMVQTAPQAIAACQHCAFDLLFVDYHLSPPLTGCELIAMLRLNNAIKPACGIVMTSGDHTSEAILTSLSIAPDAFIHKPISLGVVREKVTATLLSNQYCQTIYDTRQYNTDLAIEQCREMLSQVGNNRKLAGLLLDMLLAEERWEEAAKEAEQRLTSTPHPRLYLYQARAWYHLGHKEQAIRLLQQQLQHHPLAIELYDFLSDFLAESGHVDEALNIALKAHRQTPCIAQRTLRVAKLAADTNNHQLLFECGRSLAANQPITDPAWLDNLARYTAIIEKVYFRHHSPFFSRQLMSELEIIHRRLASRLPPAQLNTLTSFGHIYQARLGINQRPLDAKRHLLIGLSYFFSQTNKLPSAIIADALPLLIHLGEISLLGLCHYAITQQAPIGPHSQQRLDDIRQQPLLINAIKSAEKRLLEAESLKQPAPADALQVYRQVLRDYPYSSEANLGKLECLYLLGEDSDAQLIDGVKSLSLMPLPPQLSRRRQSLFDKLTARRTAAAQAVTPACLANAEN
ncbi:hypothetical protein ABT56_03490 [Photobacterium aquae]|uniref:Response regulatory domain-containing protein n=1 Tax=Photobacterium aquae TaxID=1195763 RepID=A0A0J1HC77_9GAMM|nr:response regulator [Photobacterium aquae]KLV09265.1 hypothetical protein ABT56_03490 [Photobacterium aquae]